MALYGDKSQGRSYQPNGYVAQHEEYKPYSNEERGFKRVCRWGVFGLGKILNAFFAAVLFLLFLLGTYALWDTQLVYSQADATRWQSYRPEARLGAGFEELREKNSDVVAWLEVYGTHINYPVVFAANGSDFYLNHDAKKDYSAAGSLFIEPPNKPNFSDFNTFIFGHHMAHDAMFGEISSFEDPDYFDKHAYGTLSFVTPQGELIKRGLSLVSYLSCDAYDKSIYVKGVQGEGAQQDYRMRIIERSSYTKEVPYNQEHLVLLSTCADEGTNARNVIMCYLTDSIVDDPYPPLVREGFGIDQLQGFFGFPWLGWVGVLLALSLFVLLVIWLMDRYRQYRKDKSLLAELHDDATVRY